MTDRNRRTMRIGLALAAMAVGAGVSLAGETTPLANTTTATAPASARAAVAAGWPQWRGPTRDGIAPAGPKLLDSWPKDGPPLLWKSEPIPSGGKGGCGSVTVSGGRAFVFVHGKRPRGKTVAVTAKDLADFGWKADLPDDLNKKIEAARLAERVEYLNSRKQGKVRFMEGEELDAYIKKFIATLDAAVAKQYGDYIEMRLKQSPQPGAGVDWPSLAKLAAIQDKEFASFEELDQALGGALNAWHGGPLMNSFRERMFQKFSSTYDSVVCLDAATGKDIWRQEFVGSPGLQNPDIGASSTPAIADGKCYVAGSAGFYCLSVKDGAVVWQAKTKFSNSSPLVAGGVVYVFVPELTAYDAKTGRVLWTCDKMKSDSASVVLWTSGGKDYLLGLSGAKAVQCIDPADGKVVWGVEGDGCSTPVIVGDTMVVVGAGLTMAFKITPEKGELLWKAKNNGDPRGTSALVDKDCVYKTAGCYHPAPLQCFDLKTGEEKWSPKDGKFGQTESSSGVLVDGKVIINANESAVIMFRATSEKYEELGRFNPRSAACASPTIFDGKMYLRLEGCVACYDLRADRK